MLRSRYVPQQTEMKRSPPLPAAILNDLVTEHMWTGKYDFTEMLNDENVKMFVCNGKCFDVDGKQMVWGTGSGLSKKEAKHEAAQFMLGSLVTFGKKNHSHDGDVNLEFAIDIAERNKKTILEFHLQSLCLKNGLGNVLMQQTCTGPPHRLTFHVSCTVATYRRTGSGRTKNEAKLVAITNMIKLLRKNNIHHDNSQSPGKTSSKLHSNKVERLTPRIRCPDSSAAIDLSDMKQPDPKVDSNGNASLTERTSNRMTDILRRLKEIEKLSGSMENYSNEICVETNNASTSNGNASTTVADSACQMRTCETRSSGIVSKLSGYNSPKRISTEYNRVSGKEQALSKIHRTLNNVEKQLEEQFVESLSDENLNLEVSRLKINLIYESTNQSRRIACLAETLQNYVHALEETLLRY